MPFFLSTGLGTGVAPCPRAVGAPERCGDACLSLFVCVCVSGPEDPLSMMMKVEPGSCLYLSWPATLPLHVVLQGCESVQS